MTALTLEQPAMKSSCVLKKNNIVYQFDCISCFGFHTDKHQYNNNMI